MRIRACMYMYFLQISIELKSPVIYFIICIYSQKNSLHLIQVQICNYNKN